MLLSLRLCHHIIAKEYNLLESLRRLKVKEQKISFLYNSVIIPDSSKIKRYQDRKIDILYLNSVREQRNVDVLVDALLRLVKERPHLKITICGFTTLDNNQYKMEPQYEEKILKNMENNGLLQKIEVKGFVSDSAKYLRNAKVFVFPADIVFLNYALLEAMSYGAVPVVGDGEGAEKIIKHGVNGIIAKRNSKDLAIALKCALDSLDQGLGEQARSTVIKKFGIDDWVKRMIDIRMNIK